MQVTVMALVIGSTFWMLDNTQVQPENHVVDHCRRCLSPLQIRFIANAAQLGLHQMQADARLFFGVSFMSVLFLAMG
jgi:hypothetical protein